MDWMPPPNGITMCQRDDLKVIHERREHPWTTLAAFMHRSLIMGACRRVVGFFEKPAQGDPPRRFSVAEMV